MNKVVTTLIGLFLAYSGALTAPAYSKELNLIEVVTSEFCPHCKKSKDWAISQKEAIALFLHVNFLDNSVFKDRFKNASSQLRAEVLSKQNSLEVKVTPLVFINGKAVINYPSIKNLSSPTDHKKLIKYEINEEKNLVVKSSLAGTTVRVFTVEKGPIPFLSGNENAINVVRDIQQASLNNSNSLTTEFRLFHKKDFFMVISAEHETGRQVVVLP